MLQPNLPDSHLFKSPDRHCGIQPNRAVRPTQRRGRFPVAILVSTVLVAGTLSACQPGRSGKRCNTTDWGRDSTHILRCVNKRWKRVMTFGQYVNLLAAANTTTTATPTTAPPPPPCTQRNIPVPSATPTTPAAGFEARSAAFGGLGSWVDVYDWSPTFIASKNSSARPSFTLARVDAMADAGVQVLFIQTAKSEFSQPVLDNDLLVSIIAKAKGRGMRVVGWFLPAHKDVADDLRHLRATAALGVDGIGLDIEDRCSVTDVTLRNQNLVALSTQLRAEFPTLPLAGVVLPAVVLDVINTGYWPAFPWKELGASFDAWMPMGYWTNRTTASGYRDGYKYTIENIDRTRTNLGLPNAVMSPIGGLAADTIPTELDGFMQAIAERGAIGGSLYDEMTSKAGQFAQLAPLRR